MSCYGDVKIKALVYSPPDFGVLFVTFPTNRPQRSPGVVVLPKHQCGRASLWRSGWKGTAESRAGMWKCVVQVKEITGWLTCCLTNVEEKQSSFQTDIVDSSTVMGHKMKTLLKSLTTLGAVAAFATHGVAALPNQPAIDPGGLDLGPYSVQDQTTALDANNVYRDDDFRSAAYDNFTLTDAYNLDGICWSGAYADPLPNDPSETDFIIAIWGDSSGAPDIAGGPVLTWALDGGLAGASGPDVTVAPSGFAAPANPGVGNLGGPGFHYDADITGTLPAGDYWISIISDQTFASPDPIIDPEWQWQQGDGPDDGFYLEDFAPDPDVTLELVDGKDLAFQLKGSVVPEPSGFLMALLGLCAAGLLRRKRG